MKLLRVTGVALAVAMMAGCTFVEVNPKAKGVRVGKAEDVVNCQRVGQVTVSTLARIAGLPRYETSMQDELYTLARNSAGEMGGDTVVPTTPMKDGRQTMGVYRCLPGTAQ